MGGGVPLAQPQPLSVLSSPGPAARRRPAAVHSTALPLPPGRGHHSPFRSPFRTHAVIVFTYDWLSVSTAVREFPRTFLNAMDHPGPSR